MMREDYYSNDLEGAAEAARYLAEPEPDLDGLGPLDLLTDEELEELYAEEDTDDV